MKKKTASSNWFSRSIQLNKGEVFVNVGERTNKIDFVVHGMMRNFIMNDKGQEVTVVFATDFQPITPFTTVFYDRPASETSVYYEALTTLNISATRAFVKMINDLQQENNQVKDKLASVTSDVETIKQALQLNSKAQK